MRTNHWQLLLQRMRHEFDEGRHKLILRDRLGVSLATVYRFYRGDYEPSYTQGKQIEEILDSHKIRSGKLFIQEMPKIRKSRVSMS